MTDWKPWSCIHCKSSIQSPSGWKGRTIVCPACRRAYPLIGHETAVFVKDPEQQISDTYFALERQMRILETKSAALAQKVRRGSPRSAACKAIIDAVAKNLEHVRSIQDVLFSRLPPDKQASLKKRVAMLAPRGLSARAVSALKRRVQRLVDKGADAAAKARSNPQWTSIGYMLNMFHYMRRDWGGFPLAEERIARIEAAVFEALGEHAADKTSALVLGAGLARFAWDLRPMFRHVVAVEASILAAMFHDMLRRTDVVFYEVNDQAAYTLAEQASRTVGSISRTFPEGGGGPPPGFGDLVYCVADARSMPLADRSMSAIVSIFFTDVLPLSVLLKEVKRLLMPGGVFVHLGPLDYHFDDIDERWSVEEVRGIFRDEGFDLRYESWVDDITRSEARMTGYYCNAWCFSAVYRR